jgi:hypothetical protein
MKSTIGDFVYNVSLHFSLDNFFLTNSSFCLDYRISRTDKFGNELLMTATVEKINSTLSVPQSIKDFVKFHSFIYKHDFSTYSIHK